MSNIKYLNKEEISQVSGGNANSNYESGNNTANRNSGGAPASSANNAGMGAILGTIGAIAAGATGPGGVIVGAVIGGISASLPSTSGSGNNDNRGGGWHDTNPGGMVGECRW